MKPLSLFIAVMLCCSIIQTATAQTTDTIIGYLDKDLRPLADHSKAVAYCVAVRRDSVWETLYVNMDDDRKLMHCYFKDTLLTVLHGLYQSFHEDGKTLSVRGWYNNGKQIGVWKSWYTGGTLRDSVLYEQGEPSVIYRFTNNDQFPQKITSIRDRKNNIVKYYLFDDDGKVTNQFEKKGKDEEEKYFFENGALQKHVKRHNGKTTLEVCYLETGEQAKKCEEPKVIQAKFKNTRPEFPGGRGNFDIYFQNNFRLPQNFNTAIKIGYTGKVSFMLSPKGKAYDIKILESSHPDLDQPLRNLFQNMPLWNMKENKQGFGPVIIPIQFNMMQFYKNNDGEESGERPSSVDMRRIGQ
jgi:antitoxin component YwqK of YwqJK toxin-antitoxin module